MKYGFYAPNFDFCGNVRVLAGLALDAEAAGWDGFFIWDHLHFIEPVVDPWMALAAMALITNRIRLGTLVTPVPRRHIAKLAREVITLDYLSGGRVTLGCGAGYPDLPDYRAFGDETNPKIRAAKLDEALHLLDKFWRGEALNFHGDYYQIECGEFQSSVQKPRVPVWVAATVNANKTLQRAARWDGVVPVHKYSLDVSPDELRHICDYIQSARATNEPFDVIKFGATKDAGDTSIVAASREAGATWWIENAYVAESSLESTRARIKIGPPRV